MGKKKRLWYLAVWKARETDFEEREVDTQEAAEQIENYPGGEDQDQAADGVGEGFLGFGSALFVSTGHQVTVTTDDKHDQDGDPCQSQSAGNHATKNLFQIRDLGWRQHIYLIGCKVSWMMLILNSAWII